LCWPEEPAPPTPAGSESAGDPIFTEAVRHLECGATAEAEQLLEQVILLDPRHWEALFELGHLAETQNRIEWACHYYRRAKDCGTRAWEPHYNLARLLVQAGEVEAARPLLERALLLAPDSADAASLLANVLQRSGDREEASFWLARAARLAPDRAEVWEQLAHLAMEDGRFDDAARWFAKAAGSDRDASVLFNLGLCCWKLGRSEDAAEAWSAGAAAGDTHAVHALAALAVSLGRWQVCDAALQQADHPLLRFAAAQARTGAGDVEGAIAEYRACLALQPGDAEAWLNLGVLHTGVGDSDAALYAWNQALAYDPSLAADYFG
jgi:tetratricopeptide (TPR) repeat protein